jgi:hypothetical protein
VHTALCFIEEPNAKSHVSVMSSLIVVWRNRR